MKKVICILGICSLGVTRPPVHHVVDIHKSAQYKTPAQQLPDLEGLVRVARGWEAIRKDLDSINAAEKNRR